MAREPKTADTVDELDVLDDVLPEELPLDPVDEPDGGTGPAVEAGAASETGDGDSGDEDEDGDGDEDDDDDSGDVGGTDMPTTSSSAFAPTAVRMVARHRQAVAAVPAAVAAPAAVTVSRVRRVSPAADRRAVAGPRRRRRGSFPRVPTAPRASMMVGGDSRRSASRRVTGSAAPGRH